MCPLQGLPVGVGLPPLAVGHHLQGIEVLLHHAHQVVGVGGHAYGLVEALQRPLHFLAVGLLADEDTYRGVVLRTLL